jgi:hypothetical protein
MIRFLLLVFCIVSLSAPVLGVEGAAVGDTFTVSSFVGDDFNPPTTPVLQSAIPVAPTQINLTWLPSTDDVFLMGYRVYRDGVAIATTTLTTFSDTGLSPSTTYSYMVDAYDSYGNISATSSSIATTTPALPVPPATTTATSTSSSGGSSVPTLRALTVTPGQDFARIVWATYGPTRYTIRFGRTTAYDLGTISSNVFSQNHETNLTDLEPGTRYFFILEATDGRGVTRTIATDAFTTLPQIYTEVPVNVHSFRGEVAGDDVRLSWKNPTLPAGAVVRIVRSHLYYPESVQDGALVYEGTAETFFDTRALAERSPQYYTAFVVTADGLVSSGAIVRVQKIVVDDGGMDELAVMPPEPPYTESGDTTVLRASAIIVAQGNAVYRMDTPLLLQADMPTILRIPVGSVARNLKSIIVTLENPTDQRESSSYLLKLNQSGDAYEAVIAPVTVVGQARLTVEVFDYTLASVRRISTLVTFTAGDEIVGTAVFGFWWPLVLFGVVAIGVLTLWWFLVWRRRRTKDEDNRSR